MTTPERKPCPFCGAKARPSFSEGKRTICDHCGGAGPWGESIADAIVAWNARTPAPDVSGLVQALRAIIDRWDTPAWKDAEPTGAVIERARAELAKWEGR